MRTVLPALLVALAGCAAEARPTWDTVQDSTHRVATVTGLAGPEAVRYDPSQDVWFIANFNGAAAGDSNGFISRVGPDGVVETLRFMTGTADAPLHAPRGMALHGDTLWAADADGLHAFDRASGAHLGFVDFRPFAPGFLNDITVGPDDALYVTDTGEPRIFRVANGTVTVAIADSLLGPPNGITWDAAGDRFLVATWPPGHVIRAWDGREGISDIGTISAGRFDGIEMSGGRILVASQTDSSLHVLWDGTQRVLIRTPGRPADIGVDTRRRRVAVPYIALDRVDIWTLP
jgi:sugar lactone lactonase YvrE